MTRVGSAAGVVVHSAGTPFASTGSTSTSVGILYLVPRASRRWRRSARLAGRGVAASISRIAAISVLAISVLIRPGYLMLGPPSAYAKRPERGPAISALALQARSRRVHDRSDVRGRAPHDRLR